MIHKNKLLPFFSLIFSFSIYSQKPVIKLDLNMPNRPLNEVHEAGYIPWVPENEISTSIVQDDVTFTLKKVGEIGNALRANWYKAGIQAPFYQRLGCDGVYIDGGDAGAQIELRISGLSTGTHSIMTFHNSLTSQQNAPLNIFLNGSIIRENLEMPLRATSKTDLAVNYVSFEAIEGEDTVLLFTADTINEELPSNVFICGIELNTPNFEQQAKEPYPEDKSEHDVKPGLVNMSWSSPENSTQHHVYFGKNETNVLNATQSDGQYLGGQTNNEIVQSGLTNRNMYYWRIDEETTDGTITKGEVWSFRPRQLAFPDAEGYGRFAIGGRGGKVVHVTTLEDNGPGSLRDAVENQTGPRTIVFDVAGMITLNSRLVLSDEKVTVAGQTAPGKGICIRSAPFGFTGNDVIARYIRLRLGAGQTFDGMGLTGANHSILDHASISWTIDEAFSSRGGQNISLQRTLISEALNVANHQNYPAGNRHGYAATIGGDIGSFHNNLLAHNYGRNWSLGGGLDGNGYYAGRLDITNNVVYNWGNRTTDGGAHEVNFINNYYKPGAATDHFYALTIDHEGTGLGSQRAYFTGNVMPGHFDESNQETGRRSRLRNGAIVEYETFVDEPFFPSQLNILPAREAYKNVLSDVGANQPFLDNHDKRILEETLTGTYTYIGSKSGLPGLPDHQDDVGGYEDYPVEYRAEDWDSDGDGLPDWWERLKGSNEQSPTGDFSDANIDRNGDGYTALEEYLEWMANPHYMNSYGNDVTIDLADLFKGYTDTPSYSVESLVGGEINITETLATFTPESCGLASFDMVVTDSEGSKMARRVSVYTESELPGNCLCSCENSILEAENACNIEDARIDNEIEGFSGDSYVVLGNNQISTLIWSIDSEYEQAVNLGFRYQNSGPNSHSATIYVNGSRADESLDFPFTSDSKWNSANITVKLAKGNNEISFEADNLSDILHLDLLYLPEGVNVSSCELLSNDRFSLENSSYVYPNPTSDKISWTKEKSWVLYNIFGSVMSKGEGTEADMLSLPSGVYFLKFNSSGKKIIKVIKK